MKPLAIAVLTLAMISAASAQQQTFRDSSGRTTAQQHERKHDNLS
jgi:hypothetical protein